MVIDCSELQAKKELLPNDLTSAWIVTLASDGQYANKPTLIDLTPVGTLKLFSFGQSENAYVPMTVTLSGMLTDS